MGTLSAMPSRFPLKSGATPEQAHEVLAALLIALRNLPGRSAASANGWETFRRRQQDYLSWIDNADGQLGNFTDELRIDSVLHTRGYWAIREAHPQTPWPAHLVESEIRLQKATLERVIQDLRRRIERVTGAAGHIAVVDTHLLLHFLPPAQVDWKEIVGFEPVRLFSRSLLLTSWTSSSRARERRASGRAGRLARRRARGRDDRGRAVVLGRPARPRLGPFDPSRLR
jgi:hypothetical protein